MKLLYNLLIIILLASTSLLISCSGTSAQLALDKAESLMETNPDSALAIISAIDTDALTGKRIKARYSLLKSMALDKNYIDTTTFDVLQPAIDYYLQKGNADEKLRTLYYQGIIFLNMSDFDMAMESFLKAQELDKKYTDTLTYANMLVAQGKLYYNSYQIEDYISNNLKASSMYQNLGRDDYSRSSLIRALDGCVVSHDKHRADSILVILDTLPNRAVNSSDPLSLVKTTYDIEFHSGKNTKDIFDNISNFDNLGDEIKINMSLNELKMGDPEKAYEILCSIDTTTDFAQSIRYLSVKPDILEANKRYEEALHAFGKYFTALEAENSKIYFQKTKVAEERHKSQLEHMQSIRQKDRQILTWICIAAGLVIIIGFVYYQWKLTSLKKTVAEKENLRLLLEKKYVQNKNSVLELEKRNAELECEKKNLENENLLKNNSILEMDKHYAVLECEKKNLENENLLKQNSLLEVEQHNTKLEYERQRLITENMQLKIDRLEDEAQRLKELMGKQGLSKPILASIQERIAVLNGLLAAKITKNENYAKPYDKWIDKVTEDKKSFMDSTRLAFRASHPAFMKYLDDHGLDESELNYVCLYALGLRGKEIGEYIQLKRHYHTSTDIRKKLGLQEGATNLGLHIRNLMIRS